MLKKEDHLRAALGFPFARVEMDKGLRCRFLSPSTGVHFWMQSFVEEITNFVSV